MLTPCPECKEDRHIDCDGTVKAPEGQWGWETCPCPCNPANEVKK